MTEQWKPVAGFEHGYEVSNQGRVRSLDRITDRGRKWRGRMMTAAAMPRGYLTVSLWREGKQYTRLIHRLVLSTFIGPPPDGTEALHADGNPANNVLSNLSWGTHSENQLDQIEHGTHHHASKEQCSNGHPYNEENTYHYPGKAHRACRICRREWNRQWREANPDRLRELTRKADARYRAKRKAA